MARPSALPSGRRRTAACFKRGEIRRDLPCAGRRSPASPDNSAHAPGNMACPNFTSTVAKQAQARSKARSARSLRNRPAPFVAAKKIAACAVPFDLYLALSNLGLNVRFRVRFAQNADPVCVRFSY